MNPSTKVETQRYNLKDKETFKLSNLTPLIWNYPIAIETE